MQEIVEKKKTAENAAQLAAPTPTDPDSGDDTDNFVGDIYDENVPQQTEATAAKRRQYRAR